MENIHVPRNPSDIYCSLLLPNSRRITNVDLMDYTWPLLLIPLLALIPLGLEDRKYKEVWPYKIILFVIASIITLAGFALTQAAFGYLSIAFGIIFALAGGLYSFFEASASTDYIIFSMLGLAWNIFAVVPFIMYGVMNAVLTYKHKEYPALWRLLVCCLVSYPVMYLVLVR